MTMLTVSEHHSQLTTLIEAFTNISSRLNGKPPTTRIAILLKSIAIVSFVDWINQQFVLPLYVRIFTYTCT